MQEYALDNKNRSSGRYQIANSKTTSKRFRTTKVILDNSKQGETPNPNGIASNIKEYSSSCINLIVRLLRVIGIEPSPEAPRQTAAKHAEEHQRFPSGGAS